MRLDERKLLATFFETEGPDVFQIYSISDGVRFSVVLNDESPVVQIYEMDRLILDGLGGEDEIDYYFSDGEISIEDGAGTANWTGQEFSFL